MKSLQLKKAVSLLLVLVLCLAFAACKKSEPSEPADAATAADAAANEVEATEPTEPTEPQGTERVATDEMEVNSLTTEPVSTDPDNINDGSVPTDDDKYRADLNQLALVESRNSVFAVQATIAQFDEKVKVTVQNNSAAPISNVSVAFVGLTDKGTIVDCARNPGYSMTIDTSNRPTQYYKGFVFEDTIAAGDYKEAFFRSSEESIDRFSIIVLSYDTDGKTKKNPNEDDWMYAVFYSDSRHLGAEEKLQPEGSALVVRDVKGLKAAAETDFALDLEKPVIYYNYNGIDLMGGNRDALMLTLKNNSSDQITSFKLYHVGLRSDQSRVKLWNEWVSKSTVSFDKEIVDGVGVLTCTSESDILCGDTVSLSFDCNCEQFKDYSVIVASYTTADGTEVKNPAAEQWLSAATNGEITRESN
ncbi:MAG: hypothetical protein IJL52_02815 [Clostridia bacterium]|nr:hypothetical protein [Clostridia bacterium]